MSDQTEQFVGGWMKNLLRTSLTVIGVLTMAVAAFGNIHYTVSDLNNVPGGPGAYGLSDLGILGSYAVGSGSEAQVLIDGVLTNLNDLIPADSGWELLATFSVDDGSKEIVGAGDLGGIVTPFLLTLVGDANGSGTVDGADLGIWQSHYSPRGGTGNGFWTGDWNGDGKVDGSDLALWQQNYCPLGLSFNLELPDEGINPDPIHGPEPMSLVLLAVSVGLAGPRIRRAFKRG